MNNNLLALVRNIKVKCTFESASIIDKTAIEKAVKILRKTECSSFSTVDNGFVYKKSVDARDKEQIFIVYTIAFPCPSDFCPKSAKNTFELVETFSFDSVVKTKITSSKPVVVGFGPSGMFCALLLARAGLKPIVLERGADVDTRTEKVNEYWTHGKLDKETNVQFGEGGAGTFSDGKLLTRISDKLCNIVLSEFVKFGAPEEIMYLAKPHIGTDNLRKIVKNIRNEIISLGGQVKFDCRMEKIEVSCDGRVKSVVTGDGEEICCDALFLCIGHSARDTVLSIREKGVTVLPKPFSVGVRIEHLQKDIDDSLYGKFAGAEVLGKGQYTLSKKFGTRAVYSFCMCPGGTVVASASDEGQIVTNGMSNYARDGLNANSAIAVSVDTSDYGNTVEGAIDFQHNIEKKAYEIGGNNSSAPIQLLGDFFNGKASSEPKRILPTYTGNTVIANADNVFPKFICDNLKSGIALFERDIKGFTTPDAVLTFPETRTSSPVKIPRNELYLADGFANLYPCGEGAGYAGGITSAAVDGLRAAISYLNS